MSGSGRAIERGADGRPGPGLRLRRTPHCCATRSPGWPERITVSQKFLLLQSIHHVVADGWSVPVMLRELMALYSVEDNAAGAARHRRRTAATSNGWAARDREASIAVWREALADAPEPVELPQPASTGESGSAVLRVGAVRRTPRAALSTTVGRSRGLTLSTLVHGTWGLVLGRLTGREDVLFGSTVSGRGGDLPGIETMVGLFINTVPTRLRFRPTDTVAEHPRSVAARTVDTARPPVPGAARAAPGSRTAEPVRDAGRVRELSTRRRRRR